MTDSIKVDLQIDSPKLDRIIMLLTRILDKDHEMNQELADLKAAVEANCVAIDAAVVLIGGIADRIAAAGVDPAELAALTAELKQYDAELGASVLANTPEAPPVTPPDPNAP